MRIIDEIRAERARQDEKWGEQNHSPMEWLPILMEEVGGASKAALEGHFVKSCAYYEYRKEMIHVAAVAIAMLESYDRGRRIRNEQRQP